MRSSHRGATLVEILVASFVLGLLLLALLGIYVTCSGSWAKVRSQSDMGQDLQVCLTKMERDITDSTIRSLSIDSTAGAMALSILVPTDDDGAYSLDVDTGHLRWNRYRIYYLDPSGNLMQRDVPLLAGSPQIDTPEPIETYDGGAGPMPLSGWRSGGKVVGRALSGFDVVLGSGRVELIVSTERQRYGSPTPERRSRRISCRFRND